MIYLFVFVLSTLFMRFASNYYNKSALLFLIFSLLAIMPPILIGGLRDSTVGTDTSAYPVTAFNALQNGISAETLLLLSYIEPFYFLLSFVGIKIFGNDINSILLITQIIIIICTYIACFRLKKIAPPTLSWTLYLFLFFNMSLNAMRQNIAISIVFLGFTYLIERKLFKFLIYVFIAFMFHKSAIISLLLIPCIFIESNKVNKYMILGAVILFVSYSAILKNSLSFDIMDKYEQYQVGGEYEGKLSYSELILRIVFLSLLFCRTPKNEKRQYFFNVMTLFICEFFINLLQVWSRFIGRLGQYIFILYIVYVPYYLYRNKINGKSRIDNIFFTFAVVIIYWYYVYILKDAGETSNYTSKILGFF